MEKKSNLISKYFYASIIRTRPKTKVWGIFTRTEKFKLGEVKWYAPWRQYCFFPNRNTYDETLFNSQCLIDLAGFIKTKMDNHKEKKQ